MSCRRSARSPSATSCRCCARTTRFRCASARTTNRSRFVRTTSRCGYAADDQVALRFDGVTLIECVTAREGASAWRVERDGAGVVERALPTRSLKD